jgi:hypothetical protein
MDNFEEALAAFEAALPQEQATSEETPKTVEETGELLEEKGDETSEKTDEKSEGSEETNEEANEETKEEEKVEEADERQVLLEKRERQVKNLKKKIFVETEKAKKLEAQIREIASHDIPKAIAIANARKEGDLHKMFELMGVNPEEIIDFYANEKFEKFLRGPEQIKEKIAESRLAKLKREEEEKQSAIIQNEFTQQAKFLVSKFAEKTPIVASLGAEGIDQVREAVVDKWRNDPAFKAKMTLEAEKRGKEPNFEFCARWVLPELEKKLAKKFEPVAKVFSKLPTKPVAKESAKVEKKVEKPQPVKKVEVKPEEKVQPKPIVKGSSGTRAEVVRQPITDDERMEEALRAMEKAAKKKG